MKLPPGLPEKRIRRFFKGAADPITQDFFAKWVWWWRDLPKLTEPVEGGNLMQCFLSALRSEKPEHQQEMLQRWFDYELNARMIGDKKWKPALFAIGVKLRSGEEEILDFTEAGITASTPRKEAEKLFREHLKKVARPLLSNQLRSVDNWARKFQVLELIDRATILNQFVEHDDMGPIRKLIRESKKGV